MHLDHGPDRIFTNLKEGCLYPSILLRKRESLKILAVIRRVELARLEIVRGTEQSAVDQKS